MVRCMIRSHNQQYKITSRGDDAENMCGATLEPDPRYEACCSNIFRPGKVLRDIIVGFFVVLAIAVVIAVLFVVCFYLLPATEESTLGLEESAFVGKPVEGELNINSLNEVEFTDDTRYDVRPDTVLESIRKESGHKDHVDDTVKHEEHHHMGPTPQTEAEAEAEAEAEPEGEPESEPEAKTEPEPEPETADVDHDHMHKEVEMSHEHTHVEGEIGHDHVHIDGEMSHDHVHPDGEMSHDHVHPDGEVIHDHVHTDGEMSHDHTHVEGEMHPEPIPTEGEMSHDQMHREGVEHEHTHMDIETGHEHIPMDGEKGHEHIMDHNNNGSQFDPSAPSKDEVLEVVRSPPLESTSSEMPTERTVVSVSSVSGPDAKVQIQSSESEVSMAPSSPTNDEELHESINHPHLFETLGPRSNDTTEVLGNIQPEGTPIEFVIPVAPIEEVAAPVIVSEEPSGTEGVPAGTCRPRQLEMCDDLPYGLTSLPNWANDHTEKELNEASLPFFRDVIVRSGCSPRAREYACGILEPPCNSDGSIVPPCRTFCRSVASTCQEFIISGFSLSDVFDCERFPDSSDPSVCFDMTQGDEVLVEGSRSLPHIPIDQDYPSATLRELSPQESPVPDFPDYPVVADAPTDEISVDADYSAGTENYVTASQDYPTERTDYVAENSSIPLTSVVEEDAGLPNEEPSMPESEGVEAITDATPEESLLLPTESSLTEDTEGVATEWDSGSPSGTVRVCNHENFMCQDEADCVPLTAVCDGFQQCADGSDEFNCTHTDFSPEASSTHGTPDVEIQTVFPGKNDMPLTSAVPEDVIEDVIEDATIEPVVEETTVFVEEPVTQPECPELQCLDGTCLALSQLNDGVNDCSDGTDEQEFGSLF